MTRMMQDLEWINLLMAQLNAVRDAADREFWLTRDELCMLISSDPATIAGMKSFTWRNFRCAVVAHQNGVDFWQIRHDPQGIMPAHRLIDHLAPVIYPDEVTLKASLSTQDTNPFVESKFIQVDNFLTSDEVERLLDFVMASKEKFVSTSVSTGDDDYRQSCVLYHFPDFAQLMDHKIRLALPSALQTLEMDPFEVDHIEYQLTMHNDGNYYKIHNDNGSPETASRVFTYVYYFYHQPKGFSGGELRLYDSKIVNNYFVAADSFHDIEPRHNSVVFFLSRCLHEVLPIQCPSQTFADSRFTINGWVRRQN